MERCTWTKRQDQALKTVVQSMEGEINWKIVSNILETQHKVFQKSAKKCRERWNTKINPAYNSKNWTVQEQKLMLELQGQLGNKWAIIRNFFQNRTDVFLKNQFYSIFRKALRKINDHMIKTKKYLPLREFTSTLMNNVLVVNQTKFTNHVELPQELIILSQQIKSIIIQINTKQNQQKVALIQKVILALIKFKNIYNNKSKRAKKAGNLQELQSNFVKKEENQYIYKQTDVLEIKGLSYQETFQRSLVAEESTKTAQKQQGFVKVEFSPTEQFKSVNLPILPQFHFFMPNGFQMYQHQ